MCFADENVFCLNTRQERMDSRPSIELDSPTNSLLIKMRRNETAKRIPKYEGKEYRRMYYVLTKYRRKQRELFATCNMKEDIQDPDPYNPAYVFYCFQGICED